MVSFHPKHSYGWSLGVKTKHDWAALWPRVFCLRGWEKVAIARVSALAWKIPGGAWWAAVHGVTKESNTTERLHFHFSFSCIGEGNGNPLQCSCLENPRDGGAWWAAIYGVHRVGHDWSDLAAAAAAAAGYMNSSGIVGSMVVLCLIFFLV